MGRDDTDRPSPASGDAGYSTRYRRQRRLQRRFLTADQGPNRWISASQFEFLYARQKGKKTWLIAAADGCQRDNPPKLLDLAHRHNFSV
jgi:hypothetical protein